MLISTGNNVSGDNYFVVEFNADPRTMVDGKTGAKDIIKTFKELLVARLDEMIEREHTMYSATRS